jgi:DNA-directed RNA polymerase subunit RPC12/RpoP
MPDAFESSDDSVDPVMENRSQTFRCPGCDEEVDVSPLALGRLVRCPYCNTDFFASEEQSHAEVVDDTDHERIERDRAEAFDKLRIENYTALRMSAIRARSWWLIGFYLSLLVVLDMLTKIALHLVARSWGWWPTIDLVALVLAGKCGLHSLKRAGDFKREIAGSAIPEPTTPPDFSTLNNGQDRWKHLENVR